MDTGLHEQTSAVLGSSRALLPWLPDDVPCRRRIRAVLCLHGTICTCMGSIALVRDALHLYGIHRPCERVCFVYVQDPPTYFTGTAAKPLRLLRLVAFVLLVFVAHIRL